GPPHLAGATADAHGGRLCRHRAPFCAAYPTRSALPGGRPQALREAGCGVCLWRLLMPDSRQHRGPHPDDAVLFGQPDVLHTLRLAAGDLAWLLGRQYAPTAALTLVGNHYQLHARQRQALARAVAAPAVAQARRQRHVPTAALAGMSLYVDGFNQLITIEVA